MEDIAKRLRAACNGHPHAKIPWPHRLLHEAADEIERLRSAMSLPGTKPIGAPGSEKRIEQENHRMGRNRMSETQVEALAGISGVERFLKAYAAAPDDADIEIRFGHTEGGAETMIVVTIVRACTLAVTPEQARVLADSFETAMHKFHDWPEANMLPNLILGLRAAIAKAEAA